MNLNLTNGELALLERALRMYASHFLRQCQPGMDQKERDDLMARTEAADAVFAKVRAVRGLPS